jgi:cystathionine beta-lyase
MKDMRMNITFDEIIERRASGCEKWNHYAEDVLPMWVADMDFRVAPAITAALQRCVEHGVFGYTRPPRALADAICARLLRLYGWTVTPEEIVYYPGVVTGFNLAARTIGSEGDGLLIQTPVYPPILHAPENCKRSPQPAPLVSTRAGNTLRYELDFDALEAAITDYTRALILNNPHNPSGRAFTRSELTRIAEICEQHNMIIITDEIWSDHVLGSTTHTPIASLAPEIAAHTITLMAPSKTFNLPGLGFSFGVIQNSELRQQLQKASEGVLPVTNIMGAAAALAAYTEGDDWLSELRRYLTTNRDVLVAYLGEHMPQLCTTVPEASYLAWIDCRAANIAGSPYSFFLERAKVGLTDGLAFGPGGEGFVRLNFGCPRATLMEGLDRMRRALLELGGPDAAGAA